MWFSSHEDAACDMWGKLCGLIHYNVQYVLLIGACITFKWHILDMMLDWPSLQSALCNQEFKHGIVTSSLDTRSGKTLHSKFSSSRSSKSLISARTHLPPFLDDDNPSKHTKIMAVTMGTDQIQLLIKNINHFCSSRLNAPLLQMWQKLAGCMWFAQATTTHRPSFIIQEPANWIDAQTEISLTKICKASFLSSGYTPTRMSYMMMTRWNPMHYQKPKTGFSHPNHLFDWQSPANYWGQLTHLLPNHTQQFITECVGTLINVSCFNMKGKP